jgi:hypothetical protein
MAFKSVGNLNEKQNMKLKIVVMVNVTPLEVGASLAIYDFRSC